MDGEGRSRLHIEPRRETGRLNRMSEGSGGCILEISYYRNKPRYSLERVGQHAVYLSYPIQGLSTSTFHKQTRQRKACEIIGGT
jgi:hypothetical protein